MSPQDFRRIVLAHELLPQRCSEQPALGRDAEQRPEVEEDRPGIRAGQEKDA